MKNFSRKGAITVSLLTFLCASGCSSAVNPLYQMHPQSMKDFKDRRPPRDNIFAEKGGYAKKKPIDPFQAQTTEVGAFQQGLIGDLETPVVVNDNATQQKKDAAPDKNNSQAAPQNNTAPAAGANAPVNILGNKTADARDYVKMSFDGAWLEQGSGNEDYGYSFYEIADDISAAQQSKAEIVPAAQRQEHVTKLKPSAIKAQALGDLPAVKSEQPKAQSQADVKICKLNKNNSLWRHLATASNEQQDISTQNSANNNITPQELQKTIDDKYPELKDVPAKPAA